MRPVVWLSEPALQTSCERLAGATTVRSAGELAAAMTSDSLAFVDRPVLDELAALPGVASLPIVAVTQDPISTAVNWLQPFPWLSHVMSASMLDSPTLPAHLDHLHATLTSSQAPRLLDWLEPDMPGRRVRLTHASRRVDRLERMGEFFATHGASERTNLALREAAEELLTNAFYDAPVSAGAFDKPIPRSQDVALPDEYACDLAYGCRDDLAAVRVRDPFGSLSRQRLVQVLERCSRTDMAVEVDESMGGAGLGMWRMFSTASFVVISVVKHKHTEILVGFLKRSRGQRPFAFHLFFRDGKQSRFWKLFDEDSQLGVNKSVLLHVNPK